MRQADSRQCTDGTVDCSNHGLVGQCSPIPTVKPAEFPLVKPSKVCSIEYESASWFNE